MTRISYSKGRTPPPGMRFLFEGERAEENDRILLIDVTNDPRAVKVSDLPTVLESGWMDVQSRGRVTDADRARILRPLPPPPKQPPPGWEFVRAGGRLQPGDRVGYADPTAPTLIQGSPEACLEVGQNSGWPIGTEVEPSNDCRVIRRLPGAVPASTPAADPPAAPATNGPAAVAGSNPYSREAKATAATIERISRRCVTIQNNVHTRKMDPGGLQLLRNELLRHGETLDKLPKETKATSEWTTVTRHVSEAIALISSKDAQLTRTRKKEKKVCNEKEAQEKPARGQKKPLAGRRSAKDAVRNAGALFATSVKDGFTREIAAQAAEGLVVGARSAVVSMIGEERWPRWLDRKPEKKLLSVVVPVTVHAVAEVFEDKIPLAKTLKDVAGIAVQGITQNAIHDAAEVVKPVIGGLLAAATGAMSGELGAGHRTAELHSGPANAVEDTGKKVQEPIVVDVES
jgi:hypothetical protein